MLVRSRLANRLLSIYIVWWMSLLLISTYNLFELNPVSNTAYSLLLLNVAMFTTGFLSSCAIQKNYSTNCSDLIANISITFNKKLNKKLVVLPLFLLTMLLAYYAYKYINIINNQGVAEARNLRYYVGELFGSTFELLFFNYIIESTAIIMLFVISFRFAWWGKVNTILVSLAIIYIGFFSLVGAGRIVILELGFYFVYLYLIKKIISYKYSASKSFFIFQNPINKKTCFLMIVLPLVYCTMVYLTGIRLGLFEPTLDNFTLSNRIFMEHISVYLLGPLRAFDHALYNFNESLGFNFGRLTFAGFDEIIGNFFRLIDDYQIMNHLSGAITSQGIDIGLNYEFNALYTCVYNYYFDLGLLGVILFPFFYGFVNHRIISNFECNPTTVSLFLLVFVSVSTITSVMSWKFQMPAAVIVLLGAYLFHLKNKKSFLKHWSVNNCTGA